jgi:hypothetical protein
MIKPYVCMSSYILVLKTKNISNFPCDKHFTCAASEH